MNIITIMMGKELDQMSGCDIYRTTMPSYAMRRFGKHVADWLPFSQIHNEVQKDGIKAWLHYLDNYDVFVFPRSWLPSADRDDWTRQMFSMLFWTIRQCDKRIVYEVDDDFTNEARQVHDGDAIALASWCDAIMVSTPNLAELMNKKTKRPCHVTPNSLDAELWAMDIELPPAIKNLNKIIIGLTGSITHENDWKVLATVLPKLKEEYDNIEIIMMGYFPPYFDNMECIRLPGKPYHEYSLVIRSCDIILAPVDYTDRFNKYKSPIKAIEGMGAKRTLPDGTQAGAAVIATDNEVYRLAIKHEKNGLLVKQEPEEWEKALRYLIENETKRRELQVNAYKYVWRKFDIANTWRKWERAYRKIVRSPGNTVKLPLPEPV